MADHHADLDWVALGPALERGAQTHTPLYAEALAWLRSTAGRPGAGRATDELVVDLGAGPGVITCLLAEAFPTARVIAVDATPELLDRAVSRATRAGVADRVETRVAELPEGLEGLGDLTGAADVVWLSHVLHHLGDQQGALGRIARLLRPGGLLGLAEGGLPTRRVPRDLGIGRPGLEARIDAANEAWFTDMRAELPGAVSTVEHWPGLLAAAGLVPAGSRTFLLDLPRPLDPAGLELVRHHFERSRETLGDRLDADDLAVLDQLVATAGPHTIEHRDDVFVLTATTVHLAHSPVG